MLPDRFAAASLRLSRLGPGWLDRYLGNVARSDDLSPLVFHAVDQRAHRPGRHSLGLERHEWNLLALHPGIVVVRVQDHGHAVVEAGSQGVGLGRDDGARLQRGLTLTL